MESEDGVRFEAGLKEGSGRDIDRRQFLNRLIVRENCSTLFRVIWRH